MKRYIKKFKTRSLLTTEKCGNERLQFGVKTAYCCIAGVEEEFVYLLTANDGLKCDEFIQNK